MKKIVVACGAGVCTSTVAIQKLKTAFETRGLINQIKLDQCSIADLPSTAPSHDLVVTTAQISQDFGVPVVFGLPLVSGVGVEPLIDQIIAKLNL